MTEVSLEETLDDAAASVDWVLKNITKYGGDLSKVYLAGHSAGGYIVNMLGLNKKYLAKYGIDPDKQIRALAPYSGQVITHFAQRQKQGIANLTPTIDEFAPLFHVRGDAAPMLVISGDREVELFGRYVYVDAVKPEISPTTPPPTATTQSFLVNSFAHKV